MARGGRDHGAGRAAGGCARHSGRTSCPPMATNSCSPASAWRSATAPHARAASFASPRSATRPWKARWITRSTRRISRRWPGAEPAFATTARRFEAGTQALAMVAGMKATLELMLSIGTETIERHVLRLAGPADRRRAGKGYKVAGSTRPGERSAIVSFTREGLDNSRTQPAAHGASDPPPRPASAHPPVTAFLQ